MNPSNNKPVIFNPPVNLPNNQPNRPINLIPEISLTNDWRPIEPSNNFNSRPNNVQPMNNYNAQPRNRPIIVSNNRPEWIENNNEGTLKLLI